MFLLLPTTAAIPVVVAVVDVRADPMAVTIRCAVLYDGCAGSHHKNECA